VVRNNQAINLNITTNHNNMNKFFLLLPAILMLACTPPSDNVIVSEADALFAKNSETAMALIRDFDNEDLEGVRSHFADSAQWRATTFGKTEPATLEEKVKGWEVAWATYDFNLVTNDLQLLPGVNADTKEPDGSVRVYFDWDLVRPATDSTERKSVTLTYYESWDFDADGNIWLIQLFGDETAAMNALNDM
jgi:hypothetical protein